MEPDSILVLDVVTHDSRRRRIWVRPGQVIHFGRTHRSDECFPDDVGMSSRHFVVERTADGWHCRDLKSTNGTLLNDAPIVESVLHPGDRIRAGNTTFVVLASSSGEHATPQSMNPLPATPVPTAPPAKAPAKTLQPKASRAASLRQPLPGELSYRSYAGMSDLKLLVGTKSNSDPAFVGQVLANRLPPLICCAAEHALKHCPAAKIEAIDLTGSELDGSRVFVRGASRDAVRSLIEALWGRDELLIFFGADELVTEAIRNFTQQSVAKSPSDERAVLRPTRLAEELLNQHAAASEGRFPPCPLFLEVFAGDRWGIITDGKGESCLKQLGFAVSEPWR